MSCYSRPNLERNVNCGLSCGDQDVGLSVTWQMCHSGGGCWLKRKKNLPSTFSLIPTRPSMTHGPLHAEVFINLVSNKWIKTRLLWLSLSWLMTIISKIHPNYRHQNFAVSTCRRSLWEPAPLWTGTCQQRLGSPLSFERASHLSVCGLSRLQLGHLWTPHSPEEKVGTPERTTRGKTGLAPSGWQRGLPLATTLCL